MKKFETISTDQLTQLVDDKTLLLDCRDLKDYQAGHIENALHVHEKLKDSIIKKGEKDKKIIIYCYYGHASEHLAEMFGDFGFKHVYSLGGGFASWKESQKIA